MRSLWAGRDNIDRALSEVPASSPRIAMMHNPDTFEQFPASTAPLSVSGHTHGGQIVIPGYGAAPIVLQQIRKKTPKLLSNYIPFLKVCSRVVKHWNWAEGWHQVGKNQLYVNRGLGTYSPGRFFCPPELTVITLESR